jgi:hypothetical protein
MLFWSLAWSRNVSSSAVVVAGAARATAAAHNFLFKKKEKEEDGHSSLDGTPFSVEARNASP